MSTTGEQHSVAFRLLYERRIKQIDSIRVYFATIEGHQDECQGHKYGLGTEQMFIQVNMDSFLTCFSVINQYMGDEGRLKSVLLTNEVNR